MAGCEGFYWKMWRERAQGRRINPPKGHDSVRRAAKRMMEPGDWFKIEPSGGREEEMEDPTAPGSSLTVGGGRRGRVGGKGNDHSTNPQESRPEMEVYCLYPQLETANSEGCSTQGTTNSHSYPGPEESGLWKGGVSKLVTC